MRSLACVVLALLAASVVQGATTGKAAINYSSQISQARSGWSSTSAQIAEVLERLRQGADRFRELERQINQQNDAIRDLEFKKQRALDELRRGEFCTGCGQTRSQIESSGQRFPHEGQTVRPATPEELEKCRKDFDSRLAQLRKRLAELEAQKREVSDRLSEAYFQFMKLRPLYHQQLLDERNLRLAQWQQESRDWENRIKLLRDESERVERAANQSEDAIEREVLQTRLASLARQLAREVDAARAAMARATQDERSFFTTANRDIDRLGNLAVRIQAVFGIPDGWYIDKVIRGTQPMGYTVYAVAGIDRAADALKASQSLLEGPVGSGKKESGKARPSARELLEGK
jgi:predicted  nucleic acid-binding Zn-ribbon protein